MVQWWLLCISMDTVKYRAANQKPAGLNSGRCEQHILPLSFKWKRLPNTMHAHISIATLLQQQQHQHHSTKLTTPNKHEETTHVFHALCLPYNVYTHTHTHTHSKTTLHDTNVWGSSIPSERDDRKQLPWTPKQLLCATPRPPFSESSLNTTSCKTGIQAFAFLCGTGHENHSITHTDSHFDS